MTMVKVRLDLSWLYLLLNKKQMINCEQIVGNSAIPEQIFEKDWRRETC